MKRQELYEKKKAERRGSKDFSKIKPKKEGEVWVYELNGRVYKNPDKKSLIKDLETIENG
jgi:hypothetical protein